MGASSSVLSENRANNDDSFQGVLPSSRSQRQRVMENTSLRRNISHQVNTLLVHGVQQHLNQQSPGTPPSSGSTAVVPATEERSDECKVEMFMDSLYISNWMNKGDADALYDCLAQIGEKHRPKDITIANLQRSKYPLWTKYYGLRRQRDGARALDRWGSYHESWIRVEEPPALLAEIAAKLRSHFHLQDEAVNSMVVNYYYDGDNTYIPAHRDTVACLEDDSHVICLSLGASRDFVLCANEDAGKFDREDMDIVRHWRVRHGDIFAIGKETNQAYCHAVTREPGLSKMRISVVFRSIDKSFITYDCDEKIATYKSGKTKAFKAECISTKDYQDEGTREHIADLINARELAKRSVKLPEKPAVAEEKTEDKKMDEDEKYRERYEEELFAQNLKKELFEEGSVVPAPASSAVLASYYLGQGVAVPTTLSGKVKPSA